MSYIFDKSFIDNNIIFYGYITLTILIVIITIYLIIREVRKK